MVRCFMVDLSLALGSFLSHMNISILTPNLQESLLHIPGAPQISRKLLPPQDLALQILAALTSDLQQDCWALVRIPLPVLWPRNCLRALSEGVNTVRFSSLRGHSSGLPVVQCLKVPVTYFLQVSKCSQRRGNSRGR